MSFSKRNLLWLQGSCPAHSGEYIIPVSIDDREGLQDFAENCLNLVSFRDKGDTGERLLEDMHLKGTCLMSLKSSSYKSNWSKTVRQLIFRFRRGVETAFSQFSERMKVERVLAKGF